MTTDNLALKPLSALRLGETAVIEAVEGDPFSLKLLEMGYLPGTIVRVVKVAPFGGPIAVLLNGTEIGLRREEAACIKVRLAEHFSSQPLR